MHKILAKTLFIGKKTIFLPECPSTNSLAMEYLKNGSVQQGTIIIADNQTSGRGQRGNRWQVKAGQNLTFSIILKPTFLAPANQFQLHLMVSLALVDVISELVGRSSIKWPNDIYVGNQKIAGILIENSLRSSKIEASVIGIGLNVNQRDFGNLQSATSLSLLSGVYHSREDILEQVSLKIEKYYLQLKADNADKLKASYYQNMMGYQEKRLFKDESGLFEGTIVGITQQGKLRLIKGTEEKHYDIKEVSFVIE